MPSTDDLLLSRAIIDPLTDVPTADRLRPLTEGLVFEAITYRSADLRIEGFIVRPDTPGPHPVVVYCRGGNRTLGMLQGRALAAFLAPIAKAGYLVIASQYRGVGEGHDEFGGSDVDDVIALFDVIDRLPEADGSRIGLVGWSRGALMGFLALTRTDRIDAAVLGAGVADHEAHLRERPEFERVLRELVPDFDERRDEHLIARSPVRWLDRITPGVPILVLHGTADWRVPPEHALQLATELQRLRHPYRLVMFEGSQHSIKERRDEVIAQTTAWLDRFVRDGEPSPDMEPHGD